MADEMRLGREGTPLRVFPTFRGEASLCAYRMDIRK